MTSAKPARNRVTPCGEIIAVTGRGAWMGNRGHLHKGREIVRNHQSKAWITCLLEFKGRHAPQWAPNHYTQLFFLDEAVALAAGHRPCAECRRGDYNAYRQAWSENYGGTTSYARNIDSQLHRERTSAARPTLPWNSLPDGVFVDTSQGPAVVVGDHLAVWNDAAYAYQQQLLRPTTGYASVLTPPSTVGVLRAGYPAQIDDSAS